METVTRDSTQPSVTAEEESLKRSTDCVYFLASPLTCKKGSECEYRHSEAARMNPRDCWFWLNGNCLNAKCSFRHPPLDGLLGPPGVPSAGSSLLPSQSMVSTPMPPLHAPAYNSGKQAIPCYYFQKGLCMKGDRCSFIHGPQPIDNPLQQPQAPKVATSVAEPQTSKNSFGALEKCTQQKISQENIIKPVEVATPAKPETAMQKNVVAKRNILLPKMEDERPRYKPTTVPPIISGNSMIRSHHNHQSQVSDDHIFQNVKEVDEFLGESSPGFDVLVDNELGDSNYYHKENEYGRTTGHEGKHMNPLNDFDYSHSVGYTSGAKFDRESFNDPCDYVPYGRASFERISERSSVPEKKGFPRAESSDQIDASDLRHRLSKQRRVNGTRSTISPDGRGDINWRNGRDHHHLEQRNRGRSWRDSHHLPHESSISNRLRGRITLPRRSSPDSNHNDLHAERELDRERNERLSSGRPQISSHQGRHQERIKQWGQEDLTKEGQIIKGLSNRRGEVNNYTVNFSGPKSLAELKGVRASDSSEKQQAKVQQVFPLKEQKNSKFEKLVGHQEFDDSFSFESPKPLSVILKRKREAKATSSGNGTVSGSGDEGSPTERRQNLMGSSRMTAVIGTQAIQSSESKKEANYQVLGSKEESRSTAADAVRTTSEEDEEGQISTEGDDVGHVGESFYGQKGSEPERDDGMLIDDEMEDQEVENFDHSELVDGGDLKTVEDENVDLDEEYLDDEDGDDFAKRIGILFS